MKGRVRTDGSAGSRGLRAGTQDARFRAVGSPFLEAVTNRRGCNSLKLNEFFIAGLSTRSPGAGRSLDCTVRLQASVTTVVALSRGRALTTEELRKLNAIAALLIPHDRAELSLPSPDR